MVMAVKQTVTIQPGGRVEVTSTQLPEGQQAEVIVLLESVSPRPSEDAGRVAPPVWERLEELTHDIPEHELAKLPADLAAEHDHYLYGFPKRYS